MIDVMNNKEASKILQILLAAYVNKQTTQLNLILCRSFVLKIWNCSRVDSSYKTHGCKKTRLLSYLNYPIVWLTVGAPL